MKLLDLNEDCLRVILLYVDWPQVLLLDLIHPRLGALQKEIIARRRHISLSLKGDQSRYDDRCCHIGSWGKKKKLSMLNGKEGEVPSSSSTTSDQWQSQYFRYVASTFRAIEHLRFVQRHFVPDFQTYRLTIFFGRLGSRNWADRLKTLHLELHSVDSFDFDMILRNVNRLPRLKALTFITRKSPVEVWPNVNHSFDVLNQLTHFEMALQIKWKRFQRMPRLEDNLRNNNKLRLFKLSLEDIKVTAKKEAKDGTWKVTTKLKTLLFWRKSSLEMASLKLKDFIRF